MLSRDYRFHGRKSLNAVYKYGENFNFNNVSLRRLSRKPGHKTRVAVVVSKKVNKSAVVRNRIRRRTYETIRLNKDNIRPSVDIVINIYNEKVALMEFSELNEIIDELLNRSGLLTDNKTIKHDKI